MQYNIKNVKINTFYAIYFIARYIIYSIDKKIAFILSINPENAVIAAGSVVTKNVPKNTMFAGIPAKFIKNI